ncbi:uncharacterized protein BO87DRAFT_452857 [Aspergillus neoniger CBS 115656]|uniref:Myb-like DNA-binding domain-containing protein n=1 Tax=Aspergillus neoniger (strain CBS 115656) TaxID=1448310 RepID=A0A318YR77_ASPNB|nr:hypothetical protein BO87DRAFT_452857 [Aspergillus neoniger CBS 115656]PYH36834.1 hypothetical protein BO87DRAFT_452857 [Aspergillus neoniger CBS 115656]
MSTTTTPSKPNRITPEEQLQFLLSCIRHSNSGKIDFTVVAQECNIITKAAAAKRYERLLKSHGINTSGGPLSSANNTPAKKRTGASSTSNTTATESTTTSTPTKGRKRKADGISDASKKAKGLKKMAVARAESLMQKKQHAGVGIKKEEDDDETEEDEEVRAALWEEGLSDRVHGDGEELAVKEEAMDDEEGAEGDDVEVDEA